MLHSKIACTSRQQYFILIDLRAQPTNHQVFLFDSQIASSIYSMYEQARSPSLSVLFGLFSFYYLHEIVCSIKIPACTSKPPTHLAKHKLSCQHPKEFFLMQSLFHIDNALTEISEVKEKLRTYASFITHRRGFPLKLHWTVTQNVQINPSLTAVASTPGRQ